MPPPPAQNISSQQRSWPDSANAHRARGGHWGAAALDHFDAHSASDKQMREWYGSSDHTGRISSKPMSRGELQLSPVSNDLTTLLH